MQPVLSYGDVVKDILFFHRSFSTDVDSHLVHRMNESYELLFKTNQLLMSLYKSKTIEVYTSSSFHLDNPSFFYRQIRQLRSTSQIKTHKPLD